MQTRARVRSNMSSEKQELRRRVYSSLERRHALVENENRNTIAYQLKAMKAARGWTQQQLADEAQMKQAVISKYMNGWDNYSLRTLRRLGRAYDVALLVTYVPFSELADRIVMRSYAQITVPEAKHDNGWDDDLGGTAQVTQVIEAKPTLLPYQAALFEPVGGTQAGILIDFEERRRTRRKVVSSTTTRPLYIQEAAHA